MNFIAGLLLRVMNLDEENTFYCLIHVMSVVRHCEYFDLKSNRREKFFNNLNEKIKKKHKDVYKHLVKIGTFENLEACFTTHVITLFIVDASIPMQKRIFEMFLLHGD
mmetsp:Transcript_1070/g.1368  ORF Transcript_1070/g.1368 Transcript_1070/m.1368 type:complete len:108 (-) Transcript_1070:192-515(-)